MLTQLSFPLPAAAIPTPPRRHRRRTTPAEFKIVCLRECAPHAITVQEPQACYHYWKNSVEAHPYFSPDQETLVVLLFNTRRRLLGHHLASIGTKDTILVEPGIVFRAALIQNAAAIIVMHNHPSGDPTPSEADIKVTRDLIRAGQTLKVQVEDHVVVGRPAPERARPYASLRELGYFYA